MDCLFLAFVEKSNETCTDEGENTERNNPSHLDTFYQFVPSSRWKRWSLRLVAPILYFIVVIASFQTWLRVADQSLGVQMSDMENEEEDTPTNAIDTSAGTEIIRRRGVGAGPGKVLAALFFAYGVQMILLVGIFAVLALFVMVVMEEDMRRVELGPPQLPKDKESASDTSDSVKEMIERT
eukprot:scaffold4846_cov152-Skeletonema_marinoi.AAC.20